MNAIATLDEAISVAEGIRHGTTPDELGDRGRLAGYVGRIRGEDEPAATDPAEVAQLIRLTQLCLALGEKSSAGDILDMTLGAMELAEADEEKFEDATLWNRLGALLAGQGDLVRARAVLNCALNRAHRYKSPELPRILANLSAVTLREDDHRAAAAWARKGVEVLWDRPDDLQTRLTLHRVLVDVAKARGDARALAEALPFFAEAVGNLAEIEGEKDARVFEARTALATARYRLAAMTDDAPGRERQLAELELLRLGAQVTFGPDHRVAVVAQAALAVAEFDAGGGSAGATSARTKEALRVLDAATERAAQDASSLGREHTQTRKLRTALATMRKSAVPQAELPYAIERVYTPDENEDRNEAKTAALNREQRTVRLIAHAGASYFLGEENRFHGPIVQALDRGVAFRVIISSPWSSLAAFMQRTTAGEPLTSHNIVELIEDSRYYRRTFKPVIASYENLKATYGDRVELRITSMDIPGSTLLTSDTLFFEPYITSNPAHRTRRGLRVLEVKFLKDSKYYVDSLQEFTTQWELSSTYEQFKQHEEVHKTALRSEIDALVDIQVRPSVRKGDVPRS
ncbi:tetratricopeptide repeat protein [Streptomyces lincolnensis]|uniref:tetratricopeptide repeat protein n=1 Tax=Streptomyces lincolnensis TaxID=1915 RepID=UPI001E5EAA0F|nr:tetratricopeptide repeat protein [Streptomyces lincolnensis]MCD7437271.1 tetratricopeptide repeat protein [Streptomyces lincolnensis]